MRDSARDGETGRYRELLAINRLITGTLDYRTVLRVITEQAVRLLRGGAGLLMLRTEQGELAPAAVQNLPQEALAKLRLPMAPAALAVLHDLARSPDLRTLLAVPLVLRGVTVGLLCVYRSARRPARGPDEDLLSALADQAAIALENARLYSEIHREVDERRRIDAERDRLVRELRRQRGWLRSVLDRSPVGILLIEGAAGSRMIANRHLVQILGREVESGGGIDQLAGVFLSRNGSAVSPRDLPPARAMRGEEVETHEAIVVRPDGARVPVLVTATPLRGAGGEVEGAVVTVEEITLLKDIERLREEWLAVIAHDLRQPIHAIALQTSVLARAEALSPTARARLDHILGSVRRLDRMIADLVDVSRLEARNLPLRLREVDAAALIRETVDRLADQVEGHEVRVELRGSPRPILVDPGRIEQILANLLSNAAKYGDPEAAIDVLVEPAGDFVRISVVNRGPGIPPDLLPRIFTRFARADRMGQRVAGIGLGLYITKGLVEAHGGRIWVESVPGEKTSFRFTLPCSER